MWWFMFAVTLLLASDLLRVVNQSLPSGDVSQSLKILDGED